MPASSPVSQALVPMLAGYLLIMTTLGVGLRRLARPEAGDRPGGSRRAERPDGTRPAAASRRGWLALARHVTGTAAGGYLLLMAVVIGYYYGVARVGGDFITSAFTGTAMLIAIALPLWGTASWLTERRRQGDSEDAAERKKRSPQRRLGWPGPSALPAGTPGCEHGAPTVKGGPMSKVVHFEIPIDDPDRAVGFYRDALGWEISRFGDEPYWLVRAGEDEEPGANGALVGRGDLHRSPVLTVGVDDIDDALRRVQRYGGKVAQPKLPVPGVGWSAYVLDSEGNTIGLFQPDTSATAGR